MFALLLAAGLLAGIAAGDAAAAHGDAKPEKRGILLVAFGTSVEGAGAAYTNIEKLVKEAFPGVELRWAYSSMIIRRKLAAEKNAVERDSPALALAKMMDEGFTEVVVQPLQTIPGQEFNATAETARAFSGMPKGVRRVVVGMPLLSSTQDLERAAGVLASIVPKERAPGEAVVYVGHGTHHPANVYYPGLQYYLQKKDKLAFVGTVEGSPTLADVQAELTRLKVKKAYLLPFLAVAGDHVHNDIAGDGPDSWKSTLTRAGIACAAVLKGTGESDPVAAIWVDHIKAAMEQLTTPQ
ncbi:MAG: sirohydrochlorin cobaltochelatase [Desulfovibrionaceae bacterium]|nr:sirohydrochlorin cobaltochelatase [Desulfovibrionaceae bacterium]MBF0515328.1 sirohydrochlorin cobaltochelatase [Desulfovibrionaceae bacterium]